ncbi:isoprenylcysteine carboxylmethyltransferase family protein [Morganella sp. GD04133]|uniref:isoprenylcysteine carboxylmethyltransferase family protein n=1 Tax=Morganella sp. GD04133 TaxID=2975435 RepID=UPI002449CF53|nr:isoprenylcysteine carboxylmethyltransferase family protein [Morganella sp. GD04133]MDH0355542.1 isoprenylcysteine carboxylmethyltransferase family protein [Morganella sp. GD04133]
MAVFRLSFLNWLIINGIAAVWLYAKDALVIQFSGWSGILAILIGLESLGWIGASLVYFRRHNTTPNPLGEATHLITGGLIFWLITDLFSIPQEEKCLAATFKQEWTAYCQQTRRWL